ncbi:MAG: hexitol phosphatase HxpB [Chloroflexi bacterium]|nr:hexitol phosphatase HxpB [Chloroflexota bacterium]
MGPIEAVIFDMDGLLIDTEPVWRRAQVDVFARLGLHLTEDQCLETMGVRIAEVVKLWYSRCPWTGASCDQVTGRIEDAVIAQVRSEGEAKPGVYDAIDQVASAGLPIAIASSSGEKLIRAVMERLGIERSVRVVCSAVAEREGKPHPAVYLTAARLLGVPPSACLALEDSPNGVLSAKAAGMYCVVVPDSYLAGDERMRRADLCLDSLEDFSLACIQSGIGNGFHVE